MKGEQILDEVRFLIKDTQYSRYHEINRAFRNICRATNFNWLRATMENWFEIKSGITEYEVDFSNIRRMERLFVYGVTSSNIRWHLMEEVTPLLFEEKIHELREPDGSDRETRPAWYKVEGDRISVTPTPDQDYKTRIDFIRHVPEVERDTSPVIPEAYHDAIATLAASYILEMSEDQASLARSVVLAARADQDIQSLIADSHPNRTADIDRKPLALVR